MICSPEVMSKHMLSRQVFAAHIISLNLCVCACVCVFMLLIVS